MDFRIADTFTDSLARLTAEEQKAVKTTAFDLQINPTTPGMSFHRLDRGRDKNFWSVRVSSDVRLIVHRSDGSLLLCYVDHHDKAYDWAERRRLETHPKTGAAQLVELRETVKEIVIPLFVSGTPAATATAESPKRAPLAGVSDADLLGYGVPAEWVAEVQAATEDRLLVLCEHLPAEAAEAVVELATGGTPRAAPSMVAVAEDIARYGDAPSVSRESFAHPDAQRRFRVMTNVEELSRALEYPWEKWTVFLHPEQRQWVERDYAGPARIGGAAGTGKTIVAIHRAAHLARSRPDARVLLTTFSDTLAHALRTKLHRLIGNQPRLGERIDVYSLDAIGLRLYRAHVGPATMADAATVRAIITDASTAAAPHKFTLHFLLGEWEHVVDAWQLEAWDAYRDVARLGRKTRLPETQRRMLWSIFERVRATLRERALITQAELFTALAATIATSAHPVFDFAVVDESQDLGVPHLRFLAALGRHRPDSLFFAGDLGQRIFQQPYSWKALGLDIRGRSRTLRVNYRTSHQIRTQADRLLAAQLVDVDGNEERRNDTVSVFNGPAPTIRVHADDRAEVASVGAWMAALARTGLAPHEFGVFVRSAALLDRARAAVAAAGMPHRVLDEHVATSHGAASIGTMHLAKGLEFRAVVAMACDDEVLPLQERISNVGDEADLHDAYETERHLLYVACTRARDHLLVSGVEPASVFLDDMGLHAETANSGQR